MSENEKGGGEVPELDTDASFKVRGCVVRGCMGLSVLVFSGQGSKHYMRIVVCVYGVGDVNRVPVQLPLPSRFCLCACSACVRLT